MRPAGKALLLALALLPGCGEDDPPPAPQAPKTHTTENAPMQKLVKTDAEWRAQLTPEQYRITRARGTERACSGPFLDNHTDGTYACVCCGLPLFRADAKFDSGTGWPSFFQPVQGNVTNVPDDTLGMQRTEILCARCDAHLGHVFEDGPRPTGLRYCVNGIALAFVADGKAKKAGTEKATFAAGCFWGVEAVFRKVKGVKETQVGYLGGRTESPTYEDVCSHTTRHAEAVEVEFDPAVVSYEDLLKVFFASHDPTTQDRQGPDHGDQYRSAVFTHSPEQKAAAEAFIRKLTEAKAFRAPIVTQVVAAPKFWRAEEYHQRYHEKHGGACAAP